MSDRITFACSKCGEPVAIDANNPPEDSEPIACRGCGHVFGTYGEVKAAMVEAAKAEVDKMVQGAFGKKPTWTKR